MSGLPGRLPDAEIQRFNAGTGRPRCNAAPLRRTRSMDSSQVDSEDQARARTRIATRTPASSVDRSSVSPFQRLLVIPLFIRSAFVQRLFCTCFALLAGVLNCFYRNGVMIFRTLHPSLSKGYRTATKCPLHRLECRFDRMHRNARHSKAVALERASLKGFGRRS
ncbi:hypothetical protein [Paraburkholderia sp.]|uniref:hypothetical protein n=1 Tax=Paraburkholderia sp. TaxID=1926495 RepID=UPI003D6E0266